MHVGAGVLEQLQRHLVAAELDADFLEDAIGMDVELGESFLGEHRVVGNLARDVGGARRDLRALGFPGLAAGA